MIKKGGLFASTALVILLATSNSFSFAPQPQQQRCSSSLNAGQDNCQEADANNVSTRRGFFSQIAAAASASLLLSSQPLQAAADTTDNPTRIELSVDTEYMIRVLDYFDGDMAKVMEVLIRAPSTSVEIQPPSTKTLFGLDNGPTEAILNALSSYKDTEDAARQASWIKVDKPNRTLDFLLKKRYDLSVPSAGPKSSGDIEIVLKDGDSLKYKPMQIQSTPFSLSNLEAGVGLAAVSYPLAYGLYNYESWKEDEDKKIKKAKMAAKKAAKAKAAAANKAKGATKKNKKEKATKKSTEKKKPKPVMKGQETKKSPKKTGVDESQVNGNVSNTVTNGDASNESEWFGRDVSESTVMAMVEEAESVVMQDRAQQGGYLDNLSPPSVKQQVIKVSKKKVVSKKSSSFSSYLDSL